MFSPNNPSHSHSLRPKRNRQTAATDDSVKLPHAKRKRSALRRDTFEPLAEASLNEIAGRENANEKSNGRPAEEKAVPSTVAIQSKELTFRGGKKSDKRSERGLGSLILSSNEFYTVAQLPSLPDQIRSRPTTSYSCVISADFGYALALTHTDAVLWPYQSNNTTPSSREIINFKLPFPPASDNDSLPLGAFTSRSANGEPGIVVVSSKWGKVVYWETVTNASSFVPGQTSGGVQGSVPSMLSGENICEITNVEPSGFILTFSHGRVAHLTIRDQMGRPNVGVQFLRKSYASSGTGLFGSIRNVLSGDRRRGVPTAKPAASSKGQRDVVVVSDDAEFEFWNTNISLGNSLIKTISFKDDLLEAMRLQAPDQSYQVSHFKILDMQLSTRTGDDKDATKHDPSQEMAVFILLSIPTNQHLIYYIVELSFIDSTPRIKVVHPLKCYSAPSSESSSWRPRLRIFKSQPTAVVLFEKALVLFSLVKIKESPSSQLLLERQSLPEPFQDCIRFQDDTSYKILGFTPEELDNSAACIVAVQAFGIVRLSSHLRGNGELDIDEYEDKFNVKSRIEQSVFFGSIKQNPLDLNNSIGQSFSADEVQNAALSISSEILSSTSKHLPRSAPSIDMQMRMRAKALDDLAHHLLKYYPSLVSRGTRFQLLWNAEKLAAAQAIWKVQEEIQKKYPQQDREMSYLDFTLRALHETRQKYPDAEKGEKDRVRHWLANSPANVDHLMSELVSCLDELEPMDVTDPRVVADYLREAIDLWNAAYNSSFKFREDNASQYGLGDEIYQKGILVSGYPTDLPHPWTSKPEPFRFGQRLIYDICKFLTEWWDYNAVAAKSKKKKMPTDLDGKPYQEPKQAVLEDLASRLPTEVELFSRIVKEENVQAQCQAKVQELDAETLNNTIRKIKGEQKPRIRKAIENISKFNMPGAIQLTEKMKDTGLLVHLTSIYLKQLVIRGASNSASAEEIEEQIAKVQIHAETYFPRFGTDWAFAHFSQRIQNGELGTMLSEAQADDGKKQNYLTWFLAQSQKSGQDVGKISWINDIIGEAGFDRAEKALASVADVQETNIANKKTELCLAKLAGLAAAEASGESRTKQDNRVSADHTARYHDELGMIEIQERLREQMEPVIKTAIDTQAEEDLALQILATHVVAKSPSLKRLLKAAIHKLVVRKPLSADQLIDILTLSDSIEWTGGEDNDPGIYGNEFSLALMVVEISNLSTMKKDALRALIWRRAMIRDDWLALNETAGKDDKAVEQTMQQSSLYRLIAGTLMDAQERGSSEVRVLSPLEILQIEVLPKALEARFNENEAESIRKELEKEQLKLKDFVEKAQLESHYEGLIVTAERVVRGIFDQQGDEVAEEILNDKIPNGT